MPPLTFVPYTKKHKANDTPCDEPLRKKTSTTDLRKALDRSAAKEQGRQNGKPHLDSSYC